MIEVWTFLYYNCGEYAELLRKSLEYFKSGDHDIRYKAIESISVDFWPKGWQHVGKTSDYTNGSVSHAVALHSALSYIEREEGDKHIVFIDADICMLYKGWDKVVVNKLEKYAAFGLGYPKEGYRNYHYYNFPSPHMFCFHTRLLRKIRLNFMPLTLDYQNNINVKRIRIRNDKESKLFNRKLKEKIKCDTGWLMPEIFEGAGLKTKALDMLYNHQKGIKLPWESYVQQHRAANKWARFMSEWHYLGKLFATHKKETKRGTLATDNIALVWKQRIDMYTIKEYGMIL
jgi:hypothetical protein